MKTIKYLSTALLIAGITSCADKKPPSEVNALPTIGSIERLDPALDDIVPAEAVLEILAEGHEWTEGPVWVPALKSVLYSDIPRNTIYQWREGENASVWLKPSGYTGEKQRVGKAVQMA